MNIAERILALCNERNISINRLADLSDLTQSTLNNIVNNNDPNPRYKTIEKICAGLGITLADFFAANKPDPEPELRRLLAVARRLTPERRILAQRLLEALGKD
jgi:transcriptional regulator with XRE-family HTH domain